MGEKEKILAEVSALLVEAEAVDAAEDVRYGKNRRGDELPAQLRRRETRPATICQAKQALEDQAGNTPGCGQGRPETAEDEDATADRVAAAVATATVRAKAQRNFTDPESKIMKTSDGAFHHCLTAQAVVEEEHQVILAADLGDNAADVGNLSPMTEQTILNTGHAPSQMLADAGYCCEDNLQHAAAETGTEFFIAVDRSGKNATVKQRMVRKLKTRRGRAVHAPRKTIVEPVFEQMATLQNAKATPAPRARPGQGRMAAARRLPQPAQLHGNIGIDGPPGPGHQPTWLPRQLHGT